MRRARERGGPDRGAEGKNRGRAGSRRVPRGTRSPQRPRSRRHSLDSPPKSSRNPLAGSKLEPTTKKKEAEIAPQIRRRATDPLAHAFPRPRTSCLSGNCYPQIPNAPLPRGGPSSVTSASSSRDSLVELSPPPFGTKDQRRLEGRRRERAMRGGGPARVVFPS